MLDTLLQLGRILRQSPDGLKHHVFFDAAPSDQNVRFFSVPVNKDGSFNFSDCTLVESETVKSSFFVWEYKASKSESNKKYIFGDIHKSLVRKTNKKGVVKQEESGNYFLARPDTQGSSAEHSFFRFKDGLHISEQAKARKQAAQDKKKKPTVPVKVSKPKEQKIDAEPQVALFCEVIRNFRKSFAKHEQEIHALLAKHPSVFLHFDFNGKSWYQTSAFGSVQNIVRSNFVQTEGENTSLKAFLHDSIGADDNTMPGFDQNKSFRVRTFKNTDEIENLFYALDVYDKPVYSFRKTNIVVLPKGENLTAPQLERFFNWKTPDNQASEEARLAKAINAFINEEGEYKALKETDVAYQFTQFDFIFVKKGGSAFTPDSDLIEISGLERSKLADIAENMKRVRLDIEERRDQIPVQYQKGVQPLSIGRCLLALFGDKSQDNKKFQSHLRVVLPKIYTESYFRDPLLLPTLIDKTESSLREGWVVFPRLKFDFEFMTLIQTDGEHTLKQIKDSPSYELGLMLGKMAQPLGAKIASFDKRYAGLLSRRTSSRDAVVQLKAELDNTLHRQSAINYKDNEGVPLRIISYQLSQKLAAFDGRYDKSEFALGFFETYHAPFEKKQATPPSDVPQISDEHDFDSAI